MFSSAFSSARIKNVTVVTLPSTRSIVLVSPHLLFLCRRGSVGFLLSLFGLFLLAPFRFEGRYDFGAVEVVLRLPRVLAGEKINRKFIFKYF